MRTALALGSADAQFSRSRELVASKWPSESPSAGWAIVMSVAMIRLLCRAARSRQRRLQWDVVEDVSRGSLPRSDMAYPSGSKGC
jgi:hypothetical protein